MRILFLGNNWVGWKVLQWLRDQGEDIVGLVLHPPHRQRYGAEIVKAFGSNRAAVFDGSKLDDPHTVEAIASLRPDVGVSVYFGYVLRRDFLALFPSGVVNLHPAYLPYNRGCYPNVWSIVDGTPAGVSIHYVDEGIDTGDLVAREQVEVEPIDTGESLYRKLETAALSLFQRTWPLIRAGRAPRIAQQSLGEDGTYHRRRDVERIDAIDLDRTYQARELINILRARTFPPYPGAYFVVGGRKVYLRLQLYYEDEHSPHDSAAGGSNPGANRDISTLS